MADFAQHTDPQLLDDPSTVRLILRAAELSDDAEILDSLARSDVTSEVLRKIAHNPATAERTLDYLIDLDQRWLTYPVTRRTDLPAEFIARIAHRLTDRSAIYHATSAPNASAATLRYLASHPNAPRGAVEQVERRLVTAAPPAA